MTKCPNGPKKKRVSPTGKGNPGNYRSSTRGHTWKKLFKTIQSNEPNKPDTQIHIGRQCVNCHTTVLNPRGQ